MDLGLRPKSAVTLLATISWEASRPASVTPVPVLDCDLSVWEGTTKGHNSRDSVPGTVWEKSRAPVGKASVLESWGGQARQGPGPAV